MDGLMMVAGEDDLELLCAVGHVGQEFPIRSKR